MIDEHGEPGLAQALGGLCGGIGGGEADEADDGDVHADQGTAIAGVVVERVRRRVTPAHPPKW